MSEMDRQVVTEAEPEPPIAKSLHDILHKDGSYTFDNTTDSLEAIRDTQVKALGSIVQDSAVGTGTPDTVALASSGTANTFGSWATLDAAIAGDMYISHIFLTSLTPGDKSWVLEVSVGASYVHKLRFSGYENEITAAGMSQTLVIPISKHIKVFTINNTVQARIADSVANADSYYIGISFYAEP